MAAVELLLEAGIKPTRTVVLAFGHDEERGGMRGAPAIRDWLLEKYGKDSMAMLVDEGSGLASVRTK
jgi:Gly-Xaa carboxypeptidase